MDVIEVAFLPLGLWVELSVNEYPEMYTAHQFRELRSLLREFGVRRLKEELVKDGFVDPRTGLLTVELQPFNVFARIAAGVMTQPSMVKCQPWLGKFQKHYMVACNRPECDENWSSDNPAWVGKASMSKRHALLIVKDLNWEWFNVLTFGLISGLKTAITKLEEMREAALQWVEAAEGWPPVDRVGLFMQVHAHASVKSIHLHILDMDHLGPTFKKLQKLNLNIDYAILVLERS